MRFSATDAAFEGFRLIRRKPSVLIWWTLAYLVVFAVMAAVMIGPMAIIIPQLEALEALGDAARPEDLMPLAGPYFGMLALLLPLGLLSNAISYSAVTRAVLTPAKSAWGYMRLGGDEMRVLLVSLVLGLVLIGIYMAAIFAALFAAGAGAAMEAPFMYLLAFLVGLFGFAVVIWLSVRLSLAVPLVIDRKQVNFFGSFRLTKGKFWPLLGMGLLVAIITIVISLLISLVTQPLLLMLGSGLMTDLEQAEELSDVMALMQQNLPLLGIMVLSQALTSALTIAIMLAPFTAAYMALSGQRNAAPETD
jgi:hypothetical protein